jgi:hypothetical protein
MGSGTDESAAPTRLHSKKRRDEEEEPAMHPDFRQEAIRQREREIGAALRDARAHERRKREELEQDPMRLIWATPGGSWLAALATWRLAGG